jgi:hypothetical protein
VSRPDLRNLAGARHVAILPNIQEISMSIAPTDPRQSTADRVSSPDLQAWKAALETTMSKLDANKTSGPLANAKILESGNVAYTPPAASPPPPPPGPVAAPASTPAASAAPPAANNGAAGDASNSLTPPPNVTDQDAIAKAQGQGYTLAGASTTLGANDAVSANPPPQAISANAIQFQTASGQKIVVDKNTNSALYNQAFNTAYNTNFNADWNAEQNAVAQGYTVAGADTKLAAGDSISINPPPAMIGNNLMQFQTASGQKLIVDKNTNSDLYNQAYNMAYNDTYNANFNADFNANFDAVNSAVASGYTKADATTTLAPGDSISTSSPPQEISNESITFTTNSGQKLVVDKNTNSALYNQAYNVAFNINFNNQFNTSYNDAISQGYVPATSSTTIASGDSISTTQPPTALSDSIMLFQTTSGQKVMVSKDVNSNLYNQAYNTAYNADFNKSYNSQAAATASSDKESLIAQAQSQGYTLATAQTALASGDAITANPPPNGIGPGLIEFQTNSGQKIVVDQNTNPDLYNKAFDVYYNNANPNNGAVDTSAIDNSAEAQKTVANWGTLAGNTSGTPTQEQLDLNRPLAAAQMLSDNWNSWGMHSGVSFSNPPSSLPPEAQACLKYISQNPSLLSALDGGGAKGSGNDGVIDLANVNSFISNTQGALSTATSSYSTFLKNSPNAEAGGPAQQMAQSAALLQANQQLAFASAPAVESGQASSPVGSKNAAFSADSLSGLASDSGLSPALTGAAKMWSQPGMFHNLDLAGSNPATAGTDGLANSQNITDFLTKEAPATDSDALTLLNASATRNAVAGVDTSKLGADVLANPQNYTGQQKAAVLVELTDQATHLAAGIAEGLHQPDGNSSTVSGLNANGAKVQAQLQGAITQLTNDPDVQGFLSSTKGPALQSIVGSDPQMKGAVQAYSDKVNNGSALDDQINQLKGQKDSKGNPVPMGVALQNFVSAAATANLALGGDGNFDVAAAAAKSGQLPAIQQYYQDQLVSGNEMTTDIANGTDPDVAAQKFGTNAAVAQALLGPNANAAQAATLQQNATQAYQDAILNAGDANALDVGLGNGDGSVTLDQQKLTDALNQAGQTDPSLMKDSAGDPIKSTDIAGLESSVMSDVRNGAKIPDALNKAMKAFSDDPKNLSVSPTYKQGVLHLLSAITTGGVLAARSTSSTASPASTANQVAAGLQIGGYLGEGGTKYAKEAGFGKPAPTGQLVPKPTELGPNGGVGDTPELVPQMANKGPLSSPQIENLGNAFKTLGGSGSTIGGVIGILGGVGDLKAGDKVNGGLSITSGALGVANAVGSLIEGGSGLLGGLGVVGADAAAGVGAVAGVVGGVAGAVGAVVGIVADIVDLVKAGIDWNKEENAYRSQIGTLTKYGIDGGPEVGDDYNPVYPPVDE